MSVSTHTQAYSFNKELARDIFMVLVGTAAMVVAAQFVIPIKPVPITAQNLGVVLIASSIGAKRGSLSLILYTILGASGVPVFYNGSSGVSATFGYIIGFIIAAWYVGREAQRSPLVGARAAKVYAIGLLIPFIPGLIWLGAFFISAGTFSVLGLLTAGLFPFMPGELLKLCIATGLATGLSNSK